jgi:hypothetical protein
MSLGLRGTYDKVMSANGPAQMLSYGFWSVLVAGMFYQVDPMCFPDSLIITWGLLGLAVIPAAVWGAPSLLKYILLLDMFVTAVVLAKFVMHEPHVVQQAVYHIQTATGWSSSTRGHEMNTHSISQWFHGAALVWMSFHSLYLANLIQRQQLEKKRFK